VNTAAAVGVGFHDAPIDRKPFASNQNFRHASLHNRLEYVSEHIALAKTPAPVLRDPR
jgi:hypothetical protein